MPKLMLFNDDGSYTELGTVALTSGPSSQGSIPELNALGKLDPNMISDGGDGPSKTFVTAMALVLG